MLKASLLFFLSIASINAHAAIYGADDRLDIPQIPRYAQTAKAIAVAVGHNLIDKNSDGTSRIELVDRLGDSVCSGQRFVKQASLGICTGFLLGDRYVVTAGHCVLPTGISTDEHHPFCDAFDWYFDYTLRSDGTSDDQHIPANHLYRCKRLIRAELIEHSDPNDKTSPPGNDFALIELDRPVSGDIHPLSYANKSVQKDDSVFTIGHPTGLPAKYSGIAPVLQNDNSTYFSSNLDTEGGNSGGPVFNDKNEVVGILVSGHPIDYTDNATHTCQVPNRCDENGEHCLEGVPFAGEQTSNYVQRIDEVLKYVPARF